MPNSKTAVPRPLTFALMFVAVLSLALNLRGAASAVGPLLAEIGQGLALDGPLLGLLTSLPGLIFGVMGLFAVTIARRFGLSATLTLCAGALFFGIGLRAWVDQVWLFFVLSIIGLTGIAAANVLMPAWIKKHGKHGTVALMTVYSVCVVAAGAAGAALTAPVAQLFSGLVATGTEWRWALFGWGALAIVPLVIWWFVTRRTGYDFPKTPQTQFPSKPIWTSGLAVALTLFFALQSTQVYIQFGWLPQIYRDAGVGTTEAGLLTGGAAMIGLLGSFLMPTVVDRSKVLWVWAVSFGLLSTAGYVGLWLWPVEGRWLWTVLLGLGGMAFATSISLIPARSVEPAITARLSGFVQPVGYILAGVGPMVVGVLYANTASWDATLGMLVVLSLAMAVAGAFASRNINVDDQIRGKESLLEGPVR